MKIENYYLGNICVCTSVSDGKHSAQKNVKFDRLSKQIIFASIKNSPFLIPIQMITNKQSLENLRKAVKNQVFDPNVILISKNNVELKGDYFAEIDTPLYEADVTTKQKEQIENFESLLRATEKNKYAIVPSFYK